MTDTATQGSTAEPRKSETLDEKVEKIARKTGLRAVDVLREVMTFHHDKAQDTILSILVLLKKEIPPRGDLLALMYKEYAKSQEIAVDCANKLAPYESAKLQSMEVKSETVHKFVMRTPMQAPSVDEWLATTGAKRNIPKEPEEIIRIEAQKNIEEEDDIQDIEEIKEARKDAEDYNNNFSSPTEF